MNVCTWGLIIKLQWKCCEGLDYLTAGNYPPYEEIVPMLKLT
jgi:hypothetical protein